MLLLHSDNRWGYYDGRFVAIAGFVLYNNVSYFILELQFHRMVVSSRFLSNNPKSRLTRPHHDFSILVRQKQIDCQGIKDSDGPPRLDELLPVHMVHDLCYKFYARWLGNSRFHKHQNRLIYGLRTRNRWVWIIAWTRARNGLFSLFN